MADESQTSTTSTQTCQVSPLPTITPSPQVFPEASSYVNQTPAWPYPSQPTDISSTHLLPNKSEPFCPEPLLYSTLLELQSYRRNHELILGKNEQVTMHESLAGSWNESPRRQFTQNIEPIYTVPSQRSEDVENTPTRQDSAYYSTKGAQEEETMASTEVQTRHGSSRELSESTPRIVPHDRTYTSSPQRSIDEKFRQESADYSAQRTQGEGSEISVDVQARQIRARERVVILRGRVLRTRRIIKDHKSELRRLRENFSDAVDKLTRNINEIMALGGLTDIGPYYDAVRTAQDKLGPAEEAYDLWEIRLDEEEEELDQEEDHFYRHNDVLSTAVPESKLNEEISPRIQPYQPPEPEFQNFSLENELVQEYLEKMAEADRLKEDLDELENDYYRFSGDAEFRKRHGIPLSAETVALLSDYPELHAAIVKSVRSVEDDIFDLRDRCLKEGLFGESDHIYEHYDALYEDVMDSVDEARDRSPLRNAAHRMRYHNHDPNFGDKKEYVNNWLMEWVRDSSIDVLMLKSFICFGYPGQEEGGKKPDIERWPELAIENWNRDGAGDFANEYYNASRLDAIAGSTGRHHGTSTGRSGRSGLSDSLRSLDVIFSDGGRDEDAIMGSETGSYATQKGDNDVTPKKRSKSL